MNSPEVIAAALVTYSAIGFMVILGTATFIPMVYELTLLRKEKPIELLGRYPYRLISRLGGTWSIVTLMLTSLLFITTGLLSLGYILSNKEIYIDYAVYLSITLGIILFLYVVFILISALTFKKDEFAQILDYTAASDDYEEVDIKK